MTPATRGPTARMSTGPPGGSVRLTLSAEDDEHHGWRSVDVVPDLPAVSGTLGSAGRTTSYGGTVEADAVGRIEDWPRILAWLGALHR